MGFNTIEPRQNRTTDASRLRSAAIWSNCPWEDIRDPRSRVNGFAFTDDFVDLPLQPTLTTQIAFGKYKAFGDTGNTITRVTSINSVNVPGGAIQFLLDTDNDEVSLAQAYPSALLTGSTATSGKLWFECCYAQNAIVTNNGSVFMGLANVGGITLSTTVPLNDGDPIDAGLYAVGFRIAEDGLGVVDTVYTDGATSFTNVGATEGGTLAAYTFTKFGMVYDPRDTTGAIRFFVNNVECASVVSLATLQGFTNLNANGLGLLIATTADSAGTSWKSFLKWWQVAQIFN